ncbi:MAG TPA: ATP-binding protein [Polyangia bacterium]|nr:ATP-binding protein [Polyangia bacterium]
MANTVDPAMDEAFELAPAMMGIVELTGDGDILHVRDNRATCVFFGLQPGETANRRASEMGATAEVIDIWLRHYRASAASGRPVRFEYADSGGDTWLQVVVGQMGVGPAGQPRFMYVADDVTARKRAERLAAEAAVRAAAEQQAAELMHQDLRRRTQRLETMFRENLIGNMTWRLRDGDVTSANDAFLEIVRYTQADVAAGRLSWRELTPPQFHDSDREKVDELIRTRRHPPYEKEYFRRDGTRAPVLVSSALFPDSDDEGISYVVDLTPVKAAERRIRDLLDEVTAASRAKDEFIATLAHELRNPLAPIRNAVQILRARGPTDPSLVRQRDVIDRQVQHMARLLEDLLDVSRISRAKLELRREVVDLGSVIDAAIETSRPLIEAARHELRVDVPRGELCIDGDPIRLAQVFANLLNNAAKYTRDGGLIELTARLDGPNVVVSVRDNGIGIAPEMLPTVFDMFAQAEPAVGRAQGGLGIGLSLAKGLVELHGGTIRASSDGPQRGSEFAVTLPFVAATNRAQRPEADPLGAAVHRVLVVDDNADNADSLGELLQLMGNDVRVAYDGEAALAAVAEFRPTAVLLDLGMPRMNGYDVCRRIRDRPGGDKILVVAMTGWGQPEDRRRTEAAGFDRHLVKPVDPAAVMKLLADQPVR